MSNPSDDPAIREAEARGARREREAVVRFLRRRAIQYETATKEPPWMVPGADEDREIIGWLLTREARYKRAAGGLQGRGGR